MTLPASNPVRIGIAGFGAAARAFIPAMQAHAGIELAAVAEASDRIRVEAQRLGVPVFDSLDAMLTGASIDAVYVATPTDLHAVHVLASIAAGKHVLVEKPMAIDLAQATAMVEAAERADVLFLVGHSHSYDLPIARMRDLIAGGTLGRVRMVNTWCFTDWMYRPRRPEEFDSALGGGVTYRQGAHQFDIIRLLCGGMAQSVRARTFDWNPDRRAIGAHSVFIDFADCAATAVYNGYGGFSTMDIGFDIGEWGSHQPPDKRTWASPRSDRSSIDELAAKQQRAKHAIPGAAPYQPFFGLTLVSCERGDIRQSPQGLTVYSEGRRLDIELPVDRSPRDLVMAEFHDAIVGSITPLHTGRWGLANLEICEAAIESSSSGREVPLTHQIGLPVAH